MTFVVPKTWFAGCDFTTDWSTRAFPNWAEHLGHLRKQSINVLEIGAWEGRGSVFFLNFFAKSSLTAVDIFTLGNEGRFDQNVLEKFADRTTKVKGRSTIELDRLAVEGKAFDLIYLDGSHLRDDVMIDSILAWRLLNVGGYLIWDDYDLIEAMPGHFEFADEDPKPAVDTFLEWHGAELEMLHQEYQLIVRKIAAHYVVGRTGWDVLKEPPLPTLTSKGAPFYNDQQDKIARLEEHVKWLMRVQEVLSAHSSGGGVRSLLKRRALDRQILQRAGLFNAREYLERNPDVLAAGMDPFDHYLRYGFAERRSR